MQKNKLTPPSIKKESSHKQEKAVSLADNEVKVINVKVVGIGGGANSIILEIASRINNSKVKFIAANTDAQDLSRINRKSKIKRFQFGASSTFGLGTGMKVELGERAALEQIEEIKELLKGADLCIVISCLGGGTGSGAAPVFARISKKLGNITYGIFTLPFDFEGQKKMAIAKNALVSIKPFINAFSIIPNERIFKLIDKKTPLNQALNIVNQALIDNLEGLIKMIYTAGVVNIDFADFKTTMEGRNKLAYLTTAKAQGENRAQEVAQKVLFNPLYFYDVSGAFRILFNIVAPQDLGLNEVGLVSNKIFETVNKNAKIIFGVSNNQSPEGEIKVTLLAVGCSEAGFFGEVKKAAEKIRQPKQPVKKEEEKPKSEEKAEEKEVMPVEKKEIVEKAAEEKEEKLNEAKENKNEEKEEEKEKKKEKELKLRPKPIKKSEVELKSAKKEEFRPRVLLKEQPKPPAEIRRNALQAQKAAKEIEKEILKQEEIWATPAFLRKQNKI